MKPQLTECGETDEGFVVRAITDAFGPQVVVTDPKLPQGEAILSQPLKSHSHAIQLGNLVVEKGLSTYNEWQRIPGTLFDFASALAIGASINAIATIESN